MADKFHSDTGENIESITYAPCLQNSGDMETSTKTVTATSKQGNPDYSASLTTDAPGDSRLAVRRLCIRLKVTIDSMTASHLYGAIHVNGTERKTLDFTATGDKFSAVMLNAGQFNIGIANTVEVFLWVDGGNAVISVCHLWQAVGSCDTSYNYLSIMELSHTGLISAVLFQQIEGSGNVEGVMMPLGLSGQHELVIIAQGGVNSKLVTHSYLAAEGICASFRAGVATDLLYFSNMHFALRSER